jgi:hypothetical protein
MRELHGYHGEHHRHTHDAATDAPATRAYDGPKHAAHDSLKQWMLLDPEARKAEHFKYRQQVEAAEAEYAARHAKPKAENQARASEQLKPQDPKPEHVSPETRDKPASRIDERTKALEGQREDRRTPERSRLPRSDTAQMVAGYGIALASLADAVNILPGKWDAVLTGFLGAVVATVAWANRRWKEKHGHRPED